MNSRVHTNSYNDAYAFLLYALRIFFVRCLVCSAYGKMSVSVFLQPKQTGDFAAQPKAGTHNETII